VTPMVIELEVAGRPVVCDSLTVANEGQAQLVWRTRESAARAGSAAGRTVGVAGSRFADDATPRLLEEAGRAPAPAKGERDTRAGARGSGGPDAFGYTWTDSDESGGPSFDWLDISGLGAPVALGDDDYAEVALPFTFPFYGRPQDSVRISSNGYLTFGAHADEHSHDPIPHASSPDNFVAPLWVDLDPTLGGTIHHYHDASAGRFIVQYSDVYDYWSTGTNTFQVALEPDGKVLFYYLDINEEFTLGSVGIEDAAGASGLPVVFNSSYLHDGLAVLFEDSVPWLTQSPVGGSEGGGGSRGVHVCADPTGLGVGVHEVELVFESNDPDEPEVVVAVSLYVAGPPDLEVEPEDLAFTVMGGESSCDTLTVTNAGGDTLNWTVGKDPRDLAPSWPPGGRAPSGGRSSRLAGASPDEGDASVSAVGPSTRSSRFSASAGAGPRTRGGPDAYGYTWTDSNQPDGPSFSWMDISLIGTHLPLADDGYFEFALPFGFPFYGETRDTVRVGSNGFLSFATGGSEPLNVPIPGGGDPNGIVAPFWDDLDPEALGSVYVLWNPQNAEFIVQYTGVPRASEPGSSMTFQVILREDGSIRFQYLEMLGTLNSATIGIESQSGEVGLPVACDEPYVEAELAVEIVPGCPWLTASPWFGANFSGESKPVSVCVDASALDLGEHTCNLLIRSDDPDSVTVIVPVLVYVVDTGVEDENPSRYELLGNFPNPFNPVTGIRYALPAPADVTLEVYDLSGRVVRRLLRGQAQDPGRYEVLWDGKNDRGAPVASGVYFYRLTADGRSLSRKMILLK